MSEENEMGKSSTGFNRAGGGAADGSGGFAPVAGATLQDGTVVQEVFDEVADSLTRSGYHKKWADGWYRETDEAVVTVGYSYREVRIRRYLPNTRQGGPQAVHNVLRYHDLDAIEAFVNPAAKNWGPWSQLTGLGVGA